MSSPVPVSVLSQDDPDFAKIEVSTFESGADRPKIVFCSVNNPLFGFYVVVPTTILDSRGLPHTLEHLIFTGSRQYPARGYLDKLATVCLSTGTNAYTCEDHTCYFVTTASFEGMLQLMPVYLDHVLYPRLSPEDMALEVFSLDCQSKEARGVVYCEMKSRESTEADQMDIRLRNHVFAEASQTEPHLETYRWECGGASQRVSHLTPEEIRAYHHKFYQPGRITIVVSGMFSDAEKASVLERLNSFDYEEASTVEPFEKIEQPLEETAPAKEGEFPAMDESIGSVGFGWIGPDVSDLDTIMSLHILLRALKDTSASPLYQEFVECAEPCASDIDYDVRGFKRAMLSFIFSGVPIETECEEDEESDAEEEEVCRTIKGRMFAVFQELLNDQEKLSGCIQAALRSFTLKLKEQYEEDPHELALGYCLSEILTGGAIGYAISNLPLLLKDLAGRPMKFWLDLFKRFLIDNECHETIMKPSRALSETIKQAELDNLKIVEQLDTYPKEGAALLGNFADAAMPLVPLPKAALNAIQTFASSDTLAVQIVELESSAFTTVSVGLRLEGAVSEALLPYLVVFQELLFQCDIEGGQSSFFEAGKTYTYQEVQRLMSATFTTYEAAVGMGNELFSASYLDSHLVFTFTFPAKTVEIPACIELVMDIMKHSKFTEERVQVTLDNLLSQVSDSKRDPSNVIDTCFYEHIHGRKEDSEPDNKKMKATLPVSRAINMFDQEVFMNGLKSSGSLMPAVTQLNGLRDSILAESRSPFSSLGAFVHVGVGSKDETLVERIHSLWNSQVKSTIFPIPEQLPRYGSTKTCGTVIVPMADITASFLGCSVFIPILPTSTALDESQLKVYLALAVFCHMLSFTEGPLYNRIRGKGLAYGANLTLSLWNGLLSFDLNDSTAPVEAFQTFIGLVKDVLEECKLIADGGEGCVLCGTTLMAAKASFAYSNVSDRSTPSNVYSLALRSAVRGGYPIIDADRHAQFMTLLSSMTLGDIAGAVQPYLERFLDPSQYLLVAAVPASEEQAIMDKMQPFSVDGVIRRPI